MRIHIDLCAVGVAGMKLQLNSRTAAKVQPNARESPPRPVSAKVNIFKHNNLTLDDARSRAG